MTKINGTLIWYASICDRETWLMCHSLEPDQDDENMKIGKLIERTTYKRAKKQIEVEGSKIDLVEVRNGKLFIEEEKKSSRFLEASKNQLLYYMSIFQNAGIEVNGAIKIPKEKKVIEVELNEESIQKIEEIKLRIENICSSDKPPKPIWIHYCRKCAYQLMCW